MKSFASLAAFAAEMVATQVRVRAAEEAVVERACQIVEDKAKEAIGTHSYGWPPLASSTLSHKAADTPLLETGAMRDSLSHHVSREGREVVGEVGSNLDRSVYAELGTSKQPPRSFLMKSALRSEREIVEMAGRVMAGAIADGAEFGEIWHEIVHTVHEVKEAVKDIMEDHSDRDKRYASR
jgi:HK97 gp10 family phage protein